MEDDEQPWVGEVEGVAAAEEGGRGVAANCLVEASLLLVSCCLFYNFAWIYYRERLFPHHSFATPPPTKTRADAPTHHRSGGGVLSLKAAGRAFSLTFAMSCCIFELIILEIAGLLNPASSPLAWTVCLSLMVLGLHVVLPFLLAFAWLGEVGFGRHSASVGALALLSGILFLASDIGHADMATAAAATAVEQRAPSMLSLEACLTRVGVVGVASLALLSGFGAVNLPYQQLAMLLRRVPLSLVKSRERRAMLTLKDIGQRKRRAAIAASSSSYSFASQAEDPYYHAVGHGVRGGAGGGGLVVRAVRAVAATIPIFSSRNRRGSSASPSQQAVAEAEVTASLEKIVRELFLEISDCRRIQEQQRRSATLMGRVFVAFGAVMFIYCLLRIWRAGVSVLWAPLFATGKADQAAGFEGANGGVLGDEGTRDDPATRLVRFALSRHLLGDVDAEGWSELLSFVFIGVLVLMQTRGFLVTITKVSRASIVSGLSMPPQVVSLLISLLMGAYFTSSVILMRVNLPPRHRVAITAVLGGMRFSFYQRWFDTVFLLSGCVTAVTLLVFHLANRTSDADHHGEDIRSARTAAAAPPPPEVDRIGKGLSGVGRDWHSGRSEWAGAVGAHHADSGSGGIGPFSVSTSDLSWVRTRGREGRGEPTA